MLSKVFFNVSHDDLLNGAVGSVFSDSDNVK